MGNPMVRMFSLLAGFVALSAVSADPPVASYVFPAGGKRGESVTVKVGGSNLYSTCTAEMMGSGVSITPKLTRTKTLWFEGPVLPLPDSQRAEDYPKDMEGRVTIAPDAAFGVRYLRLSTSQGATPHLKFQVGDLPEIVEEETNGDPIPVAVALPITINGRIFPRADVDVWTFAAKKDRAVTIEVHALRLGTPLEARLEVRDVKGVRLAESDLPTKDADTRLRFYPPADGTYSVAIHDLNHLGSQSHVYRLTITDGVYVDRVYPLGGKRGVQATVEGTGQYLPRTLTLAIPDVIGPASLHIETNGAKSNAFLFDVDSLAEVTAGREMDPSKKQPVRLSLPVICNGRIQSPGSSDGWEVQGKKGETIQFELRAARLGSELDGVLTVLDAKGKEVARAEAGAEGDPMLRFTPPADGALVVRVQDRFRSRGGPEYGYRLRITPAGAADFDIAFKTDGVSLLRGGQVKLPLIVSRRGGFKEDIAITIEGLPKGVTFSPSKLNAKQNALDLILKADKDAVIGAVRIKVQGSAKVDGKENSRWATLPVPLGEPAIDNVLLGVALPTPFKIKGEYDMRWASRGGWFERKYQIERLGYDGPIEVSLADKQARHLQGVEGGTIVVPAGATEFKYPVQLPPWMETGRTSRTCVMGVAKIKDEGGREHEVGFSSTNQNEQLVAVVEPARIGITLEKTSVRADAGLNAVVPFTVARGVKLAGAVKVEVIVPPHFRGVRADPVTVSADKQEGVLTFRFDKTASSWNMPVTIRATILEAGRPVIAEAALDLVGGGE